MDVNYENMLRYREALEDIIQSTEGLESSHWLLKVCSETAKNALGVTTP